MVSAEQKEYAEVFDYSKIAEKERYHHRLLDEQSFGFDFARRTNKAYKQVKKNKGKGGIDGMQVDGLLPFLRKPRNPNPRGKGRQI